MLMIDWQELRTFAIALQYQAKVVDFVNEKITSDVSNVANVYLCIAEATCGIRSFENSSNVRLERNGDHVRAS